MLNKDTLPNLTVDQVTNVYSGKPGCACGCRGKYSYNTRFRNLPIINRGYAFTDSDFNDRMVKRVVNLVKAADVDDLVFDDDGDWVAFNLSDNRTYTVYVAKG